MKIVDEGPFLVNNAKSWIHCLLTGCDRATTYSSDSYHYHDYIEMLYILTDGSYLWTNGNCRSMKKHEIVIIHSQVPHTFTYDCASKYICIKFLPHILYADDQAFFELKYVLPFLEDSTSYTVLDAKELTGLDVDGLMFETLHEWENRSFGSELIMRANILKLFAAFFRHWHRNELLNSDQPISIGMKNALNFISENYASVTEKQAAEISSLSYHYFSAVFKKTMRMSFIEYVTLLKLRAAENLLITTDLPITEIASQTGFSTTSHFIYTFRKRKNMTPKQFRTKILSTGS